MAPTAGMEHSPIRLCLWTQKACAAVGVKNISKKGNSTLSKWTPLQFRMELSELKNSAAEKKLTPGLLNNLKNKLLPTGT